MRLVLNGNLPRSTLLKRVSFAAAASPKSRSRSRSTSGFDHHDHHDHHDHQQHHQQQQQAFGFHTGEASEYDNSVIVGLPPNPLPVGFDGTRNDSSGSSSSDNRSLVSSLGLHDHVDDVDYYYSHVGDDVGSKYSINHHCCDNNKNHRCHHQEGEGREQYLQPCHCSSDPSSDDDVGPWLVVEEDEEVNGGESDNDDQRGIIGTLHLVDWNFGTIHSDVIVAVQDFLKHHGGENITETRTRRRSKKTNTKKSSKSRRRLTNVILEDCIGGECLQYFMVVIFQTVACQKESSLTIRYSKQRKMPPSIANGLYQGTTEHGSHTHRRSRSSRIIKLKSLRLEGMTLTPLTTQMLHVSIPLLKPNLRELSISGNFDLIDIDRKQISIVGRYKPEMKQSITWLRDVLYQLSSCLQVLKFECCHIPDRFLADLLETINATKIVSLNLKGNMVQEESLHMIHDILTSHGCALRHLDVSWQRLPPPANYRGLSILPLGELAHAIGGGSGGSGSSSSSSSSSSLLSLDVSHNRLTDEDVVQMSLAIQRSSTLRSLSMRHCRMSDRSMSAIAASIPYLRPQLKSLRFDGTQSIRQYKKVRRQLVQGSLQNYCLQELTLPSSCKSKTIDWIIELNCAGRRVLLSPRRRTTCGNSPSSTSPESSYHRHRPIPDNLWPTILARADGLAHRICRKEEEGAGTMKMTYEEKSASMIYTFFRESGYEATFCSNDNGPDPEDDDELKPPPAAATKKNDGFISPSEVAIALRPKKKATPAA
mmetsp:Transcript_27928/g.67688  ORF Transcript_27928/g.67688 Transcript_27928/m.67688 type:complete len:763 (-) Transcript_27928:82-2370(-)